MTPSSRFRRFACAYGAAFAVLYVVAVKADLALITVYPLFGMILPGTHHAADVADPAIAFANPAIYWYGWTATAAVGALIFGVAAAVMPQRWTERVWSGWVWLVPAAAMIACIYLTLPWFRL